LKRSGAESGSAFHGLDPDTDSDPDSDADTDGWLFTAIFETGFGCDIIPPNPSF
jgi:hypothetical protein